MFTISHCTGMSNDILMYILAVSTAPKELREVDLTAQMAKVKMKKLRKRGRRNQAMMEETMRHLAAKADKSKNNMDSSPEEEDEEDDEEEEQDCQQNIRLNGGDENDDDDEITCLGEEGEG